MPATNLDKRKVSSVNIDFIDKGGRMDAGLARSSRVEVSSAALTSHNVFEVTTFLMQTGNISRL
jgi:hypothetical protein